MMRLLILVLAATVCGCGRASTIPAADTGSSGTPGDTAPVAGAPDAGHASAVAPLPALTPLQAPKYFIHEIRLDGTGRPVVRVVHPSSRQPPPHATLARWNGTAWEELPPSTLEWPIPVPGPQGQLYVYDSEFIDRSFRIWESGGWRVSPEVPGAPRFAVRAATADRSTGEPVAVLFDGERLSVATLDVDTWKTLGTTLDAARYFGPESGLVSIAADRGAVHVAYVNGGDVVVASLGPNGWASSSLPTTGPGQASFPEIHVAPQGRLIVSWAEASGSDCRAAVSDGAGWRLLADTVGEFKLFSHLTIRDDDGAPIALFQRGFPANMQMDLAAATWKDGAWELSEIVSTPTWGDSVLSPYGDGVTSAESGGSIFFTPLHPPK